MSETPAIFRAVGGKPQQEGTIMIAVCQVEDIPGLDVSIGTRHTLLVVEDPG
jgi:hypothetical protein